MYNSRWSLYISSYDSQNTFDQTRVIIMLYLWHMPHWLTVAKCSVPSKDLKQWAIRQVGWCLMALPTQTGYVMSIKWRWWQRVTTNKLCNDIKIPQLLTKQPKWTPKTQTIKPNKTKPWFSSPWLPFTTLDNERDWIYEVCYQKATNHKACMGKAIEQITKVKTGSLKEYISM